MAQHVHVHVQVQTCLAKHVGKTCTYTHLPKHVIGIFPASERFDIEEACNRHLGLVRF